VTIPLGRLHAASVRILLAPAVAACGLAIDVAASNDPAGVARAAIIHGSASTAAQDATVRLDYEGEFSCSGTLIAPNVVLTARHCVARFEDLVGDGCGAVTRDLPAEGFTIAIGARPVPIPVRGRQLFVPPTPNLCGTDIALLLLETAVTGVPVARLRYRPVALGEQTVAVGYGADEHDAIPEVRLQRSDIVVTAIGPASTTWVTEGGAGLPFDVSPGEVAATESTCIGDSGGPLFDREGDLVAVTSRGIDDRCLDRPTLFTALAPHEDLVANALAAAETNPPGATAGADAAADATVVDRDAAVEPALRILRAGGASCAVTGAGRADVDAVSAWGLPGLLLAAVSAIARRREWG
jgi:hypothetical protein